MSFPTSNLILHLRADQGAYQDTGGSTPAASDGDPVALWQDQSGSTNHVSQATSSKQFTLKLNQINGKAAMLARSINTDTLRGLATAGTVAHGIGTGDFWFATVIQTPAPADFSAFMAAFSIGSFAPAFYLPTGGSGSTPNFYLGGGHAFDTALANNSNYLIEIARISGTVKCWVGTGGASPSLNATTYSLSTSIADAKFYVGEDNSGDAFDGLIAEEFLYTAALNGTDQTALEAYLLARYWGVGVLSPYYYQFHQPDVSF